MRKTPAGVESHFPKMISSFFKKLLGKGKPSRNTSTGMHPEDIELDAPSDLPFYSYTFGDGLIDAYAKPVLTKYGYRLQVSNLYRNPGADTPTVPTPNQVIAYYGNGNNHKIGNPPPEERRVHVIPRKSKVVSVVCTDMVFNLSSGYYHYDNDSCARAWAQELENAIITLEEELKHWYFDPSYRIVGVESYCLWEQRTGSDGRPVVGHNRATYVMAT